MMQKPPNTFQLQPVLHGISLSLRPLRAEDFNALYAVASDPLLWAQHPSPQRYQLAEFQAWFSAALADKALLICSQDGGQALGSSRYYDWNPESREVAIGFSFLARSQWGGPSNAELKQLMLTHAFQWAKTVWFHVSPQNTRSQKAMLKIGGLFSHQGPKQLSGDTQDYLFYRIDAARAAAAAQSPRT